MLRLYRAIVAFFVDSLDALRDEEPAQVAQVRFEARQERWLDYLRN